MQRHNYIDAAKKRLRAETVKPYIYLLPSLIIITIFLIIPIFKALSLSFTDAKLLTLARSKFIGLANYVALFKSSGFMGVLLTTTIYVLCGVVLTYVLGLIPAMVLNESFRGRGIVRAILILPWVVPQVVLVIIWKWMLNPGYGVLNFLLFKMGVLSRDFSWFSSPVTGMIGILLATLWKQYPLSMLILLAGLQSIPIELYEASSVDGATPLQKFIFITIPGLRYVSTVLILLSTIWHFGNFIIIWLMTHGGPADKTATLTIFTYLNAFKFGKMGFGASIGLVIFVISLVFSMIYYRLFIKKIGAA